MTLKLINLEFSEPSHATSSSSSSQPQTPRLKVTLTNFNNALADQLFDEEIPLILRYDLLRRNLPSLMAHMGLDMTKVAFKWRSIEITYTGKGAVRAFLRSLVDEPQREALFGVVKPELCTQANAWLALPVLQSSTPTRRFHGLYHAPGPSSPMRGSLNDAKRITLFASSDTSSTSEPIDFIITDHVGARRRISDLSAATAALANHLSGGLTPKSMVLGDAQGLRRALGSHFRANAVPLGEHLESLSAADRNTFLQDHAKDLGSCLALMSYIDQIDFHLNNIMYDKDTNTLFIIDFDRCYTSKTYKYNECSSGEATLQSFPPISQRDLRSPLLPMDRAVQNWFYLHQNFLVKRSHTQDKLMLLPGLCEVLASDAFNEGYYHALNCCANLSEEDVRACTDQIQNPTLRDEFIHDFTHRSANLKQQLLSMPEFLVRFLQAQDDISSALTRRIDDIETTVFELRHKMGTGFSTYQALLAQIKKSDKTTNKNIDALNLQCNVQLRELLLTHRRLGAEVQGLLQLKHYLAQQSPQPTDWLGRLQTCYESLNPSDSAAQPTSCTGDMSTMDAIPRSMAWVQGELTKSMIAIQCWETEINNFLKNYPATASIDDLKSLKKGYAKLAWHFEILEIAQPQAWIDFVNKMVAITTSDSFIIYQLHSEINTLMGDSPYQIAMRDPNPLTSIERKLLEFGDILQLLNDMGLISLFNNKKFKTWMHEKMSDFNQATELQNKKRYVYRIYNRLKNQLNFYQNSIAQSTDGLIDERLLNDSLNQMLRLCQALLSGDAKQKKDYRLLLLACSEQDGSYRLQERCLSFANTLLTQMQATPIELPVPPTAENMENNLQAYNRDYKNIKGAIRTQQSQIGQLRQFYAHLSSLGWLSKQKHQLKKEALDALTLAISVTIDGLDTRERNAERYMQLFISIYENEATRWRIGGSLGARPHHMQIQYNYYEQYRATRLSAWSAWLAIWTIGRQAASQPSEGVASTCYRFLFDRELRDDRASAYYNSFPADPTADWSRFEQMRASVYASSASSSF